MSHDPRGATSPDSNTRAGEMAADDLDRVLFDPLPTPDRFGFDAPGACQGDGPRAGWHGVRRYDGHGPATELLAEIALDGLITRGAAAALRRGAPVVLSIIVPSPAWVRPVEAALRRMSPHPVRCLSRSSPPRPSCATDADSEAADLLARGCPVIALAPDPGWIAPVLVAAADYAVTIPPLDHRQVDRAIRAWCGRRSGTALAPGDLCGLDLPDIAAALRPGSRPAACRARILRASRTRVSPSANHPVTPLAALTGYGDAQAWATRTAGDLARVRRGEASAEALEGVVLFGPPGTGKTTLARALAEAAGVACSETSVGAWFANSPGFLDSIVKQVSQFCDRLELYAKQDGCAIGFIDEIDALPNRSKLDDRNYSWWAPLITYFLTRCESLRKSGVVLIGATNHLDRVDPALLRPGRFDRQFLIAPPDEAGRLGILRNHLGAELERVDLTPAARLSRGMTGAVLAGHVRAARRRATGAGRPMVLDDLMAEIAPAEQRPAAHLRAVALHEAGHALLGHRLGLDVEQVTLQGGVGHAGMTLLRLPDPIPDRAGLERRIVAVLGGRAADSVLGSGPTAGASADLREATRLLAALHGSLGLGATLRAVVDQEHADVLLREDPGLAQLVEGDLRRLQDTAEIMVRADRAAIHRLVKALEADRVVTGGEVAAIAKAHPPRYRIPARVRPRTR